MDRQQQFPKQFLWGASTASHQVEGGTVNQWSVWELENASELAKHAHASLGDLANWPDIKAEATRPENYISGEGIDHYHRYEEDFDLLARLNLNTFRFGIEWSRLEPEEGTWDEQEIHHYHDYIDSLNRRGIEPVLNIWHWTVPTWFAERGGFARKANLMYFERFVQRVAEEYGHKLRYVITLNEPNVYTSLSYLTGDWPPQIKKPREAYRVYRNLMHAHRRAYSVLKAINPELKIGVAIALTNMQAERPHNLADGIATKVMRYVWNWWFLNRIRSQQEFIGINYYNTDYYKVFSRQRSASKPRVAHEARIEKSTPLIQRENPAFPVNDLGWYMEPEGLYPLLLRTWVRYRLPIIVTENGLADANDEYRRWWLQETVMAMRRALSRGVDLQGYLHWSLVDNFEWAYGWWPKFGLVAVDREHDMKRTIRPSARWFGEYIRELQGLPKTPDTPPEPKAAPKAPAKPTEGKRSRYRIKKYIS